MKIGLVMTCISVGAFAGIGVILLIAGSYEKRIRHLEARNADQRAKIIDQRANIVSLRTELAQSDAAVARLGFTVLRLEDALRTDVTV